MSIASVSLLPSFCQRGYLAAAFLSVTLACCLLQITSLRLPLNYFGDTIFYAMTIQSVIDTGWYLTNPELGAPGTLFLGDFPTPEGLNYLLIKGLTLFSSNWVVVLNLFFLLGFPLITLSSFFVLRKLSLSTPFALTASLLYTFLPYHLIREESHLFLSAYYLIPLAIWVALLLYQNHQNIPLWIAFLIGSNGIYHAYFSAFFFLLAGGIGSYLHKTSRPLKIATYALLTMLLALLINLWPTLHSQYLHGANLEILHRDWLESETCGLKIAQLLLPRDAGHLFASFKEAYNQHSLAITENASASLGFVGAAGFLLLITHLFFRRKEKPIIDALAHFNLGALLLATIGGFSSLIALFALPGIRAYNRISVFIGFFALAALFLFLQEKSKHPKKVSLALLAIGLFTQTSPHDVAAVKFASIPIEREYKNDRKFAKHIQTTLPQGSAIFQLPYICFPEGARDKINSYAHFKLPLHARGLRWSFGSIRGRETAAWQERVSNLEPRAMVKELIQHGFSGLYIDACGYDDHAQTLEENLSEILVRAPLFDRHHRSFWDLRDVR